MILKNNNNNDMVSILKSPNIRQYSKHQFINKVYCNIVKEQMLDHVLKLLHLNNNEI